MLLSHCATILFLFRWENLISIQARAYKSKLKIFSISLHIEKSFEQGVKKNNSEQGASSFIMQPRCRPLCGE
jgi:hypothetical protein